MSDFTHADLTAAIAKARKEAEPTEWDVPMLAHLDTLAAILDLHRETTTRHACHAGCHGDWPCPTVGVVVDALRKMGAL